MTKLLCGSLFYNSYLNLDADDEDAAAEEGVIPVGVSEGVVCIPLPRSSNLRAEKMYNKWDFGGIPVWAKKLAKKEEA